VYADSFVINTFGNGVLTTIGKLNAESFDDEAVRIKAIEETEALLRQRFAERGFRVDKLLLRNYRYVEAYEKSWRPRRSRYSSPRRTARRAWSTRRGPGSSRSSPRETPRSRAPSRR